MLKRDILELCLLSLLRKGDEYGYELLRRLRKAFPDTQESAIYAILRGLCREGELDRYYGETSDGPVRMYYHLTSAGLQKQECLLEKWRALKSALSELGIE